MHGQYCPRGKCLVKRNPYNYYEYIWLHDTPNNHVTIVAVEITNTTYQDGLTHTHDLTQGRTQRLQQHLLQASQQVIRSI